jgi:ribosome maturation protein Sdo1
VRLSILVVLVSSLSENTKQATKQAKSLTSLHCCVQSRMEVPIRFAVATADKLIAVAHHTSYIQQRKRLRATQWHHIIRFDTARVPLRVPTLRGSISRLCPYHDHGWFLEEARRLS